MGEISMQYLETILQTTFISGVVILFGAIFKVPRVELNIWQWLLRGLGRAINGEVLEKVDDLQKDLEKLKLDDELERVRQARQRILRFSDEILYAQRHSKEHFDEILEDIDLYEDYCREHEEYENNKAVLAITIIRDVYKTCLKEHDFLVYTKKIG